MTLKEKITQVIVDLNKESVKYPRMKTNDVTFMLAKLINDYHESDNNGWIKIESENDLPITDGKTIQYFFVTKAGNITENGYCDLMKNKKIQYSLVYTHYQQIIKPEKPLY
ncbi:MAG: hypothetical protein RL308_2202 [Bacteroidota bacterium]|jgi:hypothetical protein